MSKSTNSPKVFVSYSRADTKEVLPLVDRLEEETGVHFWIDREGIESAAQFEEVIIKAIDQAEVVLFMLSDNSQHSPWTKDEISYAKNTGKRVVPIVLHGGELQGWFLFKFGRINYIDATQDDQLQRLATDIREWLHVRKEQAPHVERLNFTETIRISDTPAGSTQDGMNTTSNVRPNGNIFSLFLKKHRKGCVLSLTITLACCAVIVFILPTTLLYKAGNKRDQRTSSIPSQNAALTCPNCNGKGNVSAEDGAMVVCVACNGRGTITDKTPIGIVGGHIYVDLGLSVRWAMCNIGALSQEQCGDYYAWGEISPKTSYSTDNSVTFRMEETMDIGGDSIYDAARANWGGSWRLPTETEAQELIDDCTWEWTEMSGHAGCRVTGPSGLSIFLPASGLREEGSLLSVGEFGGYWTSSAAIWGVAFALTIDKSPFRVQLPSAARYVGYTIRPVCE